MRIIAWAYDAEYHCHECAVARFGEDALDNIDTTDSEGNSLHPVYGIDIAEINIDGPQCCGDCFAPLTVEAIYGY